MHPVLFPPTDSHFATKKPVTFFFFFLPVTFLIALSDFLISVIQGTPCISHRAKLLQSCPTLCDSMDYSLPGSSGSWYSLGNNTGAGCHSLLQGIFPTLGLNLCLLRALHWLVNSLSIVLPGKPFLTTFYKTIVALNLIFHQFEKKTKLKSLLVSCYLKN